MIQKEEMIYEIEYLISACENEFPSAEDIVELLESMGVLNEEDDSIASDRNVWMRNRQA